MIAIESVHKFLSVKNIAVAGVSRSGKKFGNSAYNFLKSRGYNVFPVNPHANIIKDDICYKTLDEIKDKIDGVLIVLPPDEALNVIQLAYALNIKNIWLQQGAESNEAERFCREKGMNLVCGQCILMYVQPSSFPHNLHRWINKITHKLPQ